MYWLYYFAAHRMHHDVTFAHYIFEGKRYAVFPEIVEFYTGIDRRRSDAISIITKDLKEMDQEFLTRTGIAINFNPFETAQWNPTPESIERMHKIINSSVNDSTLPQKVKDAISDKTYDRAKPYNQELASYLDSSTLLEMVQAMRCAARALRNSDHVPPIEKIDILNQILLCWLRVCQILVLLSPILATRKHASFEGMGFELNEDIGSYDTNEKRWNAIMTVIFDNVVKWFQEDLFSKKMGALFSEHIKNNHGKASELMLLVLIVRLRPPNWEKEIESYIGRTNKNSYYLSRIFASLRNEYDAGPTKEMTRQHLKYLSAATLAKHSTKAKQPNTKSIKAIAEFLDGGDASIQKKPQKGPVWIGRPRR
jgi:hypothetical protein